MKRLVLIILAVIFLAGCSSKAPASQNSNTAGTGNVATSLPAETAKPPVGILNGADAVSIKGEDNGFTLHSINFLDENTGWMIKDRYNSVSNKTDSQLLFTHDGGVHWEKTGPDSMTLNKVKFVDSKTGWVISQDGDGNASGSSTAQVQYKILYTQDGGATWNVQWQGKQASTQDLDLWFQDKSNGFALVGDSLLATHDSGNQWSPVSFGTSGFAPQHMSFTDAETGWIIGTVKQKNGISVLHTTDGGGNWNQQFKQENADGPAGSIGIDFIDAKTGWFMTSNMATWNGELYYTDDAGSSWQKINQIKCVRPTPESINFISGNVGWIPLNVGAGPIAGGLMFTDDGGKSFNVVGRSGNEESSISQKIESAREVDFISGQKGLAIGMNLNYGDYLVRTLDGGKTWTQIYPNPVPFKDMSFVDNQHGFGVGQLADPGAVLCTSDGGESWESVYSFVQDYCPERLSFIDRNNGWILAEPVGSSKSSILKTADGGRTWNPLGDISDTMASSADYFKFFDADNGIVIESGNDRTIYRTKDGGKSWTTLAWKHQPYETSQYSFISAGEGWEICNPGNYKTSYDVKISHATDGAVWQASSEAIQGAYVYAFTFLSDSEAVMLAEEPPFNQDSRMKLLVTEDAGKTWTSHLLPEGINGNTLVMLQNQLPMQFTDDAHGWLLTAHGLLGTEDGGKTWTWK